MPPISFLTIPNVKRQPYHEKPIQIISITSLSRGCIFFFFFFAHFYFPASGQAVVTGVAPSPPRFLPSIFTAHRVQQSHCSSNFHRVLLTPDLLAFSASQLVGKKKSPRIYTSMHSGIFKLTKMTYTRREDNLIHRGDRLLNTIAHPDEPHRRKYGRFGKLRFYELHHDESKTRLL